jgi:hypothetical protein
MLVRCLKQNEVTALSASAAPQKSSEATGEDRAPGSAEAVKDAPAKDNAAKDGAAKVGAAKETKEPATKDATVKDADKPIREAIVDKVGPIVVDTGELPLAVKKLSEPKDRYLECVNKNGGLQADSAEVQVRFLVRERGRAEGVSVAKSKGMSAAAARCIADVVDRRYVGYPAAPIVGATLPIVLSTRSK